MEGFETAEQHPEATRILAELRSPLTEMKRLLESTTPALQVAHSLHYELLRLPQLAQHPALLRFTHAELWVLHTEIALAGLLTRALRGETTPSVLLSIGESLALLGFLVPRADTFWRAFMRSPAATLMPREVARLDRHLALDIQANQALQALAAAVRPRLESLTGVPWIIPAGVAISLRET